MSKKHIIGVDVGATNLKVASLDLKYRVRDKEVIATDKKNLIYGIYDSIERIIENNGLNKRDILGIGIGLPGPVDTKLGIVHFLPNIPGFQEVNLKGILEKRLRMPVFLDNDVKLMTIAEYKLGSARGFKNALCLTLGTGVGGGIIIGGRLYRGENNAAGELGHLPINEEGPVCNCGGIACLERYIGNRTILEEARDLFKRDISLEELSLLAKRGNRQALKIWHNLATHLGSALVGVVNLLNLDAIIIGGGVANAGAILFDRVEKLVKRQAMKVQAKQVKILKAKLGNDAGLIGAAILVKERLGGVRF